MSAILRWLKNSLRRPQTQWQWDPVQFPDSGFEVIPDEYCVEEETMIGFPEGIYYPVRLGEVIAARYQIIAKLGFGISSTVWLAGDLEAMRYVALKIFVRGEDHGPEFDIYEKLSKGDPKHPGSYHVMKAIGRLDIPHPDGDHQCLIMDPMWDSYRGLMRRNGVGRLPPKLLKYALKHLFLALDYLHTECKLIHTDLKADNLLIHLNDHSILDNVVADEKEDPVPRKFVNGKPIYVSRGFDLTYIFGRSILGDFGLTVSGEQDWNYDAQPDVYRSPEVMLKMPWSYPIDIWNVGAMVWDFFEKKHMFHGQDPDGLGYSTVAHLAEAIAVLGPPPLDLIKKGAKSNQFFDDEGRWIGKVDIESDKSLEDSEEYLEGEDKVLFLKFIRKMLQWRPEDRATAKELLTDEWLNSERDDDMELYPSRLDKEEFQEASPGDATEPPAIESPASEPLATGSPDIGAPAAEPPAIEPPASEPPAPQPSLPKS